MEENLSVKFYLNGKVQGVGMRYFVHKESKKLGLKGYVKNLRDGRVEGILYGKKEDIHSLFHILESNSPGNITRIDKEKVTLDKTPDKFTLKIF